MLVVIPGQRLPWRRLVDVLRERHEALAADRLAEIERRTRDGIPLVDEANGDAPLESLPPFVAPPHCEPLRICPRSVAAGEAAALLSALRDGASALAAGQGEADYLRASEALVRAVVADVDADGGLVTLDEDGAETPVPARERLDAVLAQEGLLLHPLTAASTWLLRLDPFARARCGVRPPQT